LGSSFFDQIEVQCECCLVGFGCEIFRSVRIELLAFVGDNGIGNAKSATYVGPDKIFYLDAVEVGGGVIAFVEDVVDDNVSCLLGISVIVLYSGYLPNLVSTELPKLQMCCR
ncbi:unnamed protein product, partial [Prunus brigantina]